MSRTTSTDGKEELEGRECLPPEKDHPMGCDCQPRAEEATKNKNGVPYSELWLERKLNLLFPAFRARTRKEHIRNTVASLACTAFICGSIASLTVFGQIAESTKTAGRMEVPETAFYPGQEGTVVDQLSELGFVDVEYSAETGSVTAKGTVEDVEKWNASYLEKAREKITHEESLLNASGEVVSAKVDPNTYGVSIEVDGEVSRERVLDLMGGTNLSQLVNLSASCSQIGGLGGEIQFKASSTSGGEGFEESVHGTKDLVEKLKAATQ